MANFNNISAGQDTRLRGADQQETTRRTRNLLYEGPTFLPVPPPVTGGDSGVIPTRQIYQAIEEPWKGLKLHRFTVHNHDAAAQAMGLGFRWHNSTWEAGTWDETATTYARVQNFQARAAAQLGPATLDDDDGIIILSDRKWDWLSLNVTTASVHSANTVSATRYSDELGTGWLPATGLTIVEDLDQATELGLGEQLHVWAPPKDWGKSDEFETLGTGIKGGKYAFNLRFTTSADTTDPVVTGIELGFLKHSGLQVAANGIFEEENANITDFDADGVVAFFELLDPDNMVAFEVQCIG